MLVTKLNRHGNSLIITVPKAIVTVLNLRASDYLKLHYRSDGTVIMTKLNLDEIHREPAKTQDRYA